MFLFCVTHHRRHVTTSLKLKLNSTETMESQSSCYSTEGNLHNPHQFSTFSTHQSIRSLRDKDEQFLIKSGLHVTGQLTYDGVHRPQLQVCATNTFSLCASIKVSHQHHFLLIRGVGER